jgi:hypothetical protein
MVPRITWRGLEGVHQWGIVGELKRIRARDTHTIHPRTERETGTSEADVHDHHIPNIEEESRLCRKKGQVVVTIVRHTISDIFHTTSILGNFVVENLPFHPLVSLHPGITILHLEDRLRAGKDVGLTCPQVDLRNGGVREALRPPAVPGWVSVDILLTLTTGARQLIDLHRHSENFALIPLEQLLPSAKCRALVAVGTLRLVRDHFHRLATVIGDRLPLVHFRDPLLPDVQIPNIRRSIHRYHSPTPSNPVRYRLEIGLLRKTFPLPSLRLSWTKATIAPWTGNIHPTVETMGCIVDNTEVMGITGNKATAALLHIHPIALIMARRKQIPPITINAADGTIMGEFI